MYTYVCLVTMPYSRNWHGTVNQLHFNENKYIKIRKNNTKAKHTNSHVHLHTHMHNSCICIFVETQKNNDTLEPASIPNCACFLFPLFEWSQQQGFRVWQRQWGRETVLPCMWIIYKSEPAAHILLCPFSTRKGAHQRQWQNHHTIFRGLKMSLSVAGFLQV